MTGDSHNGGGEGEVLQTPLYALHQQLNAKLVPFAGYALPLQYPGGILQEHRQVRSAAGLFDVSHMGQIRLRSARLSAAAALEQLVPADLIGLRVGRQRYALLTNEAGGIRDDLMVSRYADDDLLLVVNGACKIDDFAYLQAELAGDVDIEMLPDLALLALQGPQAGAVLAALAPAVDQMIFMDVAELDIDGQRCRVSRSGYSGEDGFELSLPAAAAESLARRLLEQPAVAAAGLGARDSLRLEAGLCLYGHDLDTTTTPIEAGLAWSIQRSRRADGQRAGGFPGADVILSQLQHGPSRCRVGLRPQGRVPVREGAVLSDSNGQVGVVTSGGFGPSVATPVAMGYVDKSCVQPGTPLQAEVRGRAVPVEVAKLPFVEQRYRRKA